MTPGTTEITRLKNLFSRLSGSLLGAMPARLRTRSARPRLPLLRLIARNERLGAATEAHPRRATGTALSQPDSIDEALRRSQAWLLSRQDLREGFWVAELEADATLISEYVMLRRFLGLSDPERERKVVGYLKHSQLADGGWAIYYGGPAEISASMSTPGCSIVTPRASVTSAATSAGMSKMVETGWLPGAVISEPVV